MAQQLITYGDIISSVLEKLGIQSSDTLATGKIKRAINEVYLDEVVPFKRWMWLQKSFQVVHKPAYIAGTVAVEQDSTTVTFSTAPTAPGTEEITQISQLLSNTNFPMSSSSKYTAQSFTPTSGFDLVSVQWLLRSVGASGATYYTDLCADNAGIPGAVLGTSAGVSYSDIPTSPAGGNFIPFDFPIPVSLTTAIKYHLIIRAVGGTIDGSNLIRVMYQNTDVLSNGNLLTSGNSGSTWTPLTTSDAAFKILDEETTGEIGGGSSFAGYQFSVANSDQVYMVATHTANATTFTLTTPYQEDTNATITFKIWRDRFDLPVNAKEVVEIWHKEQNSPLNALGPQGFRQLEAQDPKPEGAPTDYNTWTFFDPNTSGDNETEAARFRQTRVYPAINNKSLVLNVDYIEEATALESTTDEPLMPIGDRVVLFYGALAIGYTAVARDEDMHDRYWMKFQQKLSRMSGDRDSGQDTPHLRPNPRYVNNIRRSGLLKRGF